MIYAAAAPPPRVEELPEDWVGIPLGPCESVRSKLSSAVPQIDWSDPTWGQLDERDYSIEFNIGEDEPCESVMLHIRGSDAGNFLHGILRDISQNTGWYIMVGEEWFHQSTDPMKGFGEFTAFRDKLFQEPQQDAKPFWKRWLGL